MSERKVAVVECGICGKTIVVLLPTQLKCCDQPMRIFYSR